MLETEGYVVVWKGKGEGKGSHKGVVTWSCFPSKAEFLRAWEQMDNSDEVIAEGVTQGEAVRLVRGANIRDVLNSALLEAGADEERLGMILMNVVAFRSEDVRRTMRDN